MIKLNLPKDENNTYILDRALIEGNNSVIYDKFGSGTNDKFNFVLMQDGRKIFCKYRNNKEALYSEILFEKFCQRNGVPSAKIDFALENGKKVYVMSEDVNSSAIKAVKPLAVIFDRHYTSSVVNYFRGAKKYAEEEDISLDKDLYYKLIRMSVIDYLTANVDRNEGNFMFQIKEVKGKKTFTLAPLFDNEFAFAFDDLDKTLDKYKRESIEFDEDSAIYDTLNKIQVTQAYDYLPCISIQNKLEDRESYLTNLANEMIVEPRLIKLLDDLDTDFVGMAKEIKEETGLEIPEIDVKFAENLISVRKVVLLNKIAEQEEKYDQIEEREEEQ